MRTGASRLIRSVSPKTYSSATKSPATTTSAAGNAGRSAATWVSSDARGAVTGVTYRAPPERSTKRRGSRSRGLWPGLPAAVEPVPAVGVNPHVALQPIVEILHEGEHVRVPIAGVRNLQRPLDHHLLATVLDRDGEREEDGRAG